MLDLTAGFESPYLLELLATVHWIVNRDEPSAADDAARVTQRVQEWSRRKAGLFGEDHVALALDRLRECGWLEPTLVSAPG